MAYAEVQAWQTTFSAGASAASSSLPNAPGNGNIVYLEVVESIPAGSTITPTDNFGDSGGGAWQIKGPIDDAAGTLTRMYQCSRVIGTGASGKQVTATPSGAPFATEIFISESSGNATSPDDGSNSAAGSSNAPSPGAIATSDAGMVIGLVSAFDSAPTAGTGFTKKVTSTVWGFESVEIQITSASGSYTADWSTAGSGAWNAAAAAYKIAASATFNAGRAKATHTVGIY